MRLLACFFLTFTLCANSQLASADIFSWFKSNKSKPPENIQEQAPNIETNKHSIAKKQQAQFSEVVFHYFKEDYIFAKVKINEIDCSFYNTNTIKEYLFMTSFLSDFYKSK